MGPPAAALYTAQHLYTVYVRIFAHRDSSYVDSDTFLRRCTGMTDIFATRQTSSFGTRESLAVLFAVV